MRRYRLTKNCNQSRFTFFIIFFAIKNYITNFIMLFFCKQCRENIISNLPGQFRFDEHRFFVFVPCFFLVNGWMVMIMLNQGNHQEKKMFWKFDDDNDDDHHYDHHRNKQYLLYVFCLHQNGSNKKKQKVKKWKKNNT